MFINDTEKPWYKEAYVWLVITFPASAIIAGFYTLFLSIISYDGLVVDDYYKQGLSINKRLEKIDNANNYGLAATTNLSKKNIRLNLSANKSFKYPDTVTMTFTHATRQGFDQTLLLVKKSEGLYESKIKPLIQGRWNIYIEQDDWRYQTTLYQ